MRIMNVILLGCFFSEFGLAKQLNEGTDPPRKGKIVNDTSLHEKPEYHSDVLSNLVANESLIVSQRQRAWYLVTTENKLSGWIKMLNVRFVALAKRQGELGVKSLLDSVVSKQVRPTASTGIRGFDEENLKKAKANLQQLKLLKTLKVTPEQAKIFADKGKLKSTFDVDNKIKRIEQ